MAHRAVAWLLYSLGAPWFYRRRNRDKLVVVCYHGVTHRPGGVPGDSMGLQVRATRFARQLAYLRAHYSVLSLADYRRVVRGSGQLPPNPLLITFDDGLRNCLTAARPALESKGLPAAFFIITSATSDVERATDDWTELDDHSTLSWADAARLCAGDAYEIGSHTATHKWLPALDEDGLVSELVASAAEIRARLRSTDVALAYPWGGRDDRVRRVAGTVHDLAFTTDGGVSEPTGSLLEVTRVLVGDHDDRAMFALRVAGVTRGGAAGGPPTGWEHWRPG